MSESQERWPRPFGRYTLLAPLAQGGMGEVYIALSGNVSGAERLCVLKMVRSDLAGDPEFVGRFVDEGRVVCALSHASIAQVYEVGQDGGAPFLAMEYVPGEDLDRILQAAAHKNALLHIDFVLSCIVAALDGLAHAHRATAIDGTPLHLVHRDISPQNIRVGWDGEVKLLDFGTARAAVRQTQTAHGVVFGKPGYMAPEQARGEELDGRADLFALGIVTWELLAGAEVHRSRTGDYMVQIATTGVKLPPISEFRADVPTELDAWIMRMTAYRRDNRFPDASAARRTLMEIAAQSRVVIDRESVAGTMTRLLGEQRETARVQMASLVSSSRTTSARLTSAVAIAPPPDETVPREQTQGTATEPGQVIPGTRYRVGKRLGSGGMGEVFAAEQVDLGRSVAIKVLFPEHSQNVAITRRFRAEARMIAALSHPNLVSVLDFGTTADGRLFYAMERLEGATLRERLDANGKMPAHEVVRIANRVARGLSAAHAGGLVHRDLKPENIFLESSGGVKLLDFGVAKAKDAGILSASYTTKTVAGELFGSPGYISPEQGTGKPVDARTDIYSLGAVMYEALAGVRVFDGDTMVEVLARHIAEAPKPIAERSPGTWVPPSLERLVMDCLAKDAARRPASAAVVLERLASALDDADGQDPALGIEAPRRSGGRTSRVIAIGVGLAAVGITAAVMIRSGHDASASHRVTGAVAATSMATVNTPPETALPTPAPIATGEPTPPAATVMVAPQPSVPGTNTIAAHTAGHPHIAAHTAPPAPNAPPTVVATAPSAPATAVAPIATPTPAVTPTPAPATNASPPHPTNHYDAAQTALHDRHFDAAIDEANQAIAAHQHPVEARILMGVAYIRSDRRGQAIEQWRMVLARDPSNGDAQRYLRAAGEDPERP